MNTSGSHHQLRKLDLRLRAFIGATHSRGGVYMYSNHQGCDGGHLYYDGCSCVVVNGDVVAQGSQFSLKDVEVVVAQIDLDAGLAVVPIWDSNRRQISGMLTASDFILILMELHRNRATLTDEQLEVHTISAWKEGKSQQYGEAFRAAQLMFGRPLIWAGPDESLKDVALMILQNKISTVPIIYSTIEESCPLLLHIACLGGILKYICRHFKNHLDCLPILRQPVGSLSLGTWKSEVGEAHGHLLALRPSETLSYALNILIEAQISSIPIVDGKGSLINVYSRSDITTLAKDGLYTRIQLDQTIMSQGVADRVCLSLLPTSEGSSVTVARALSIFHTWKHCGGALMRKLIKHNQPLKSG